MKSRIVMSILCAALCVVMASCRSSGTESEPGGISEFREFGGCSLSVSCMLVTPETLGDVPDVVRGEAEKFLGKPGTVVAVSSLRPRYLRLIRQQGRLLLGSVELNPSTETVYLCVLSGIGDEAESVRSIRIENPNDPDPWDLGIFIKRYPELSARLGALLPGDDRFVAAVPAARELLRLGSTRTMLEKHGRAGDAEALEEARQAEAEQIAVLERILESN